MNDQRLKMIISARQAFEKFVKLEERANKLSDPAESGPFRQEAESWRQQAEKKYAFLSEAEALPLRLPITSADSNALERIERTYVDQYTPEWLHAKYVPLWTQFEHSLIGEIPRFLSPIFNAPVRMSILFRPEGMKAFGWKPHAASAERRAWRALEGLVKDELEFVSPARPPAGPAEEVPAQAPAENLPAPDRPHRSEVKVPDQNNLHRPPSPALPDASSGQQVPVPAETSGPDAAASEPGSRDSGIPTPDVVLARFPDLAGKHGGPKIFPFKLLPLQAGSERGILYDQTGSLFEWLKPSPLSSSRQPASEISVDAKKLQTLCTEMLRRQIKQIHVVVAPPALQSALQQLVVRPEAKAAGLFSKQTILMPPQAFKAWVRHEAMRLPVFSDGETFRTITAPHPLAASAAESQNKSASGMFRRLFSRERSESSKTESPQIIYIQAPPQSGANTPSHVSPGQFVENVQTAFLPAQDPSHAPRQAELRTASGEGLSLAGGKPPATGSSLPSAAGVDALVSAPRPLSAGGSTAGPQASADSPSAGAIWPEPGAGNNFQPTPGPVQTAGYGPSTPGAAARPRAFGPVQAAAYPPETEGAETGISVTAPSAPIFEVFAAQPGKTYSSNREEGHPGNSGKFTSNEVVFVPQPEIRPLGMPVAKIPGPAKTAQSWRDSSLKSLILLMGGKKSAGASSNARDEKGSAITAAEKPAPERRLAAANREEAEWNPDAASDEQSWSTGQLAKQFVAWFSKVAGKAKEQDQHPKKL